MGKSKSLGGCACLFCLSVVLSLSLGCAAEDPAPQTMELGLGEGGGSNVTGHWAPSIGDATISKSQPNTNFGTSTGCIVDGGSGERSCLMGWDLSAIPRSAVVVEAIIALNITDSSPGSFPMYFAKRAATESGVTWNATGTGSSWSTPGAKHTNDRGGPIATVPGTMGQFSVPLGAAGISIVQSWVSTWPYQGGVIIANETETNGIVISAREASGTSQDPKLLVYYEEP